MYLHNFNIPCNLNKTLVLSFENTLNLIHKYAINISKI